MFKIVKDSEKSLREKCKDVPLPLREEDEAFVHEMMDYLKRTQDPKFREKHPTVREGVGLAAPQVGRNIKAIVIYYPLDQEGKEHVGSSVPSIRASSAIPSGRPIFRAGKAASPSTGSTRGT